RTFRLRHAHSRSEYGSSATRVRLFGSGNGAAMAGSLSGVQAESTLNKAGAITGRRPGATLMARIPSSPEQIQEQYGPHLNYTPEGGWGQEPQVAPDRIVKTHCCFCGQQCGIQLKR